MPKDLISIGTELGNALIGVGSDERLRILEGMQKDPQAALKSNPTTSKFAEAFKGLNEVQRATIRREAHERSAGNP